jgi:NADH:ubiquinone oxidoreductase subunit 6 (subunit J)
MPPILVTLGPLLIPLIAGAFAVYLLLPRPRPYPAWWGAGLGTVALALGGVWIVRVGALTAEVVLFYCFSGIAILAGGLLLMQKNPARAALSFALVVLASCGLFLLLGAPFLTAATVIIYAGAIVVTFLFVLMLAQQEGPSDADWRSREPLLVTLTGFVLLGAILYVLQVCTGTHEIDVLLARTQKALDQPTIEQMAEAAEADNQLLFNRFVEVLDARGLEDLRRRVEDEVRGPWEEGPARKRQALETLLAIGRQARARLGGLTLGSESPRSMSSYSGPAPNVPAPEIRRDAGGLPRLPAENAAHLGRSLFTDYLLPLELGGVLLLVAVIGSIIIAHRHEDKPA